MAESAQRHQAIAENLGVVDLLHSVHDSKPPPARRRPGTTRLGF